ncbi:hypothetical protein Cgig2_003030 [Carnegiea gigantea]|uniref:Uncharacterized protein n=1 Tax=Carnegiea gigantea TaxID=171969 RepID=A0A9Q1JKY4_9CARY|nr:hypothetical protein Cgig2_003030 [Carnegiea gigantea]
MIRQGPLPPKKDLVFRLQNPSPEELDEWEHSVALFTGGSSCCSEHVLQEPWIYSSLKEGLVFPAFPNTSNYLTSHVDLIEPGSPNNYGSVPVYGYGEGPYDGDSSRGDGGIGPRHHYAHGFPAKSSGGIGPSHPSGAHSSSSSHDGSYTSNQGHRGHSLHEQLTKYHAKGPMSVQSGYFSTYNSYLRNLGLLLSSS